MGGYIDKLAQKCRYNSILAAYPLLRIFSTPDNQIAVLHLPPVARFKVKGHAFSPIPAKCACILQPSPSPVHAHIVQSFHMNEVRVLKLRIIRMHVCSYVDSR